MAVHKRAMSRLHDHLKDHLVEQGSLLWLVASVQFILVMFIAQGAYGCSNYGGCYNMLVNPISNLGSAGISNGNPPYFNANGVHVSWPISPLWPLFNFSLILFGALVFAGVLLIKEAFRRGIARDVGLTILVIAGFATACVGVFPEDTVLSLHSIAALIAFVGSGLSLLVLAASMRGDSKWGLGWLAYTAVSGAFSLAVSIIFFFPSLGILPAWKVVGSGFGFGGMERLIAFPIFIWLIIVSFKLLMEPHPSSS